MKVLQAYLICFLISLVSVSAAVEQLQLDSTSISTLQSHSGKEVILTGYFRYGFERSLLLPRRQESVDLNYQRAVWVELANGEEWKFLSFPFQGAVKVEGVMNAEPGKRYGHLGAFDAELTDARIQGVTPRLLGVIVAPVTLMVLIFGFRAISKQASRK